MQNLIKQLNDNYQERLMVLATIEEIRQHHLVRDNAEFYLDKNGELKAVIKSTSNLSYAERMQVEGRIAKIHSLLNNYNQNYRNIRNEIAMQPLKKANYLLKECVKESIRLYDEVNDALVKDMKKAKALDQDFQGKVNINTLKNNPRTRKVTLTVLQQYINYEIDCYKQFEEDLNNSNIK